ncbi:MAG: hypothetical protein JXQ84_07130 [Rhodospirillaceae bacterium]|nr:hypothetical protein [Rhodospirillaceae bacterium]
MTDIPHMLHGFQAFRSAYFEHNRQGFTTLVENGQSPKVSTSSSLPLKPSRAAASARMMP